MMVSDPDRADGKVQTICLLILTTIAVGIALSLLQPVLVPFFLALFLTYCLTPVIDLQVHYLRLPRSLAVLGAGLLGLVILLLFSLLALESIGKMARNFEDYHTRLGHLAEEIGNQVPLEKLGLRRDVETGDLFTLPEEASRQVFASLLRALSDLISTGALVLVFMLFILLGRKQGIRAPTSLLAAIESRVQSYIRQMVFLCTLTGLLVGLTLGLLGVEFAWLFGFLTFLLNFIPNVGSIIATLLPLPIILLSPDLSVTTQVLALALPGAIQLIIGSIIQPRLQGGALQLHPVTILMALIFFGMIWGIIGAFLAVPITAVIRIILERIPDTRPMAELLAGNLELLLRPGPAERFD